MRQLKPRQAKPTHVWKRSKNVYFVPPYPLHAMSNIQENAYLCTMPSSKCCIMLLGKNSTWTATHPDVCEGVRAQSSLLAALIIIITIIIIIIIIPSRHCILWGTWAAWKLTFGTRQNWQRQWLRRRRNRPPLPSMILCNARSLRNKMNRLRLLWICWVLHNALHWNMVKTRYTRSFGGNWRFYPHQQRQNWGLREKQMGRAWCSGVIGSIQFGKQSVMKTLNCCILACGHSPCPRKYSDMFSLCSPWQ